MTTSQIEDMINAVASFLEANMATYVAQANAGRAGYQAPVPAQIEAKEYIPDVGPFPYGMVNLDQARIEDTGNASEVEILQVSVNFGFTETNPDDLAVVEMRYMDALTDLVSACWSLGGVVDIARLTDIDKASLPADGKGFVMATLTLRKEIAY